VNRCVLFRTVIVHGELCGGTGVPPSLDELKMLPGHEAGMSRLLQNDSARNANDTAVRLSFLARDFLEMIRRRVT
jgi:hypothetical protein